LSGVSFVEHFSAVKAGALVIATSGLSVSDSELKENSPEVGAVVRKPMDERVLITAVQKLLKSRWGPTGVCRAF
jgi:hypothetical protein